ncbi:MAG TPA: protein translocase subunit SecDF, partial [Saprospiraceae bacterium]|nr:protein translocase subunit SecDF [Saprospiraceae bacterium]
MQGKGLIKLFLILLTLVCLIQLAYYIPTNKVEKNAISFAESKTVGLTGDEALVRQNLYEKEYKDSMANEVVFKIPGIVEYTYNDLKSQQLALGLDLKGGMSAVLEVDLKELLITLAGRSQNDPTFKEALEKATEAQLNSQSDFVTLFGNEFQKIANGKSLASIFSKSDLLKDVNLSTPDEDVLRQLREEANQTVGTTFRMLKERIDRLGVAQPNIQLDEARDLILVELPGIENKERAKQFLVSTAKLEFWPAVRLSDDNLYQTLLSADKRLEEMYGTVEKDSMDSMMDTLGLNENKGPLLSLLNLPSQALPAPRTVMGLADKVYRDSISNMLNNPSIRSMFPRNIKFLWSYKPYTKTNKEKTNLYELYAVKLQPGSDKAPIEGDVVTDASEGNDPVTGKSEVRLVMNNKGANLWARMTDEAYKGDSQGQQREIAISLDNQVVTAPSVNNGAITGGISSISGDFTVQEAVDLANILEVGKLPATTRIIQSSEVGPSLGKENIRKSYNSL